MTKNMKDQIKKKQKTYNNKRVKNQLRMWRNIESFKFSTNFSTLDLKFHKIL